MEAGGRREGASFISELDKEVAHGYQQEGVGPHVCAGGRNRKSRVVCGTFLRKKGRYTACIQEK